MAASLFVVNAGIMNLINKQFVYLQWQFNVVGLDADAFLIMYETLLYFALF